MILAACAGALLLVSIVVFLLKASQRQGTEGSGGGDPSSVGSGSSSHDGAPSGSGATGGSSAAAGPGADAAATTRRREEARALLEAPNGPTDPAARKANCTRAIELDPSYAPAYFERARALLRTREYAKADADLAEAIARDDRLAGAYELRAILALDLLGDPASAERDFRKVASLDPNGPRGRFADILVAFAHGDDLDAVERLGEFLKKNSRHADAHLRRAQSLLRYGNAAEALPECDAAIVQDGNDLRNLIAHVTRAEARRAKGEAGEAKKDLESALALDPHFGPALLLRAELHAAAGEDAEVLADLDAALASGLDPARIHLARGRHHVAKGELEAAAADFHAAAQLTPNGYEPYAALGHLLLKQGNMEHAVVNLERALKLAPKGPKADELRKRLEIARKRRAVEEIPLKLGKEYAARGDEYINLKEYEMAERDYLKAVELDPTISSAWYNLACIDSLAARIDQSVEHLRKAFENGFKDFKWAGEDSDLENLRKDPRFAALLQEFKKQKG